MKHYVYILAVLFGVVTAKAQNENLFEKGNAFYNAGQYNEAIEAYTAILKNKVHSAELYYNLANAHYKLNNVAPSVYYYEKALLLSPTDADINNNIVFAQNMTVDAIETLPEVGLSRFIKQITHMLTVDAWAVLSIVLALAIVFMVLWYYFSETPSKKRIAFLGSVFGMLFLMVSLALAFNKFKLERNDNPAIVFASKSQVKTEPNLRSEDAFELHEGTKVQVADSIGEWKEIKIANGKTGWIISEDIKLLKAF